MSFQNRKAGLLPRYFILASGSRLNSILCCTLRDSFPKLPTCPGRCIKSRCFELIRGVMPGDQLLIVGRNICLQVSWGFALMATVPVFLSFLILRLQHYFSNRMIVLGPQFAQLSNATGAGIMVTIGFIEICRLLNKSLLKRRFLGGLRSSNALLRS